MGAQKQPAPDQPERRQKGWLNRLGWFVLLWLAGVGTVGAVAFVLRLWIA